MSMRSALIILAFIGLGLSSCGYADKPVAKKQYKYYCVMHLDIGSDKPGVCSKCGMELVEREDGK